MSGQCKHCGHDGCVCDNDERTMNDTPRTNDIIEQIKGFRTSSAIYSLEQFSRLLERELTAVTEQRDRLLEQQEQWRLSSVCRELTEQRDRLAEALERILNYQGRFAEEEPESIATEALQSLTQSPNNA